MFKEIVKLLGNTTPPPDPNPEEAMLEPAEPMIRGHALAQLAAFSRSASWYEEPIPVDEPSPPRPAPNDDGKCSYIFFLYYKVGNQAYGSPDDKRLP